MMFIKDHLSASHSSIMARFLGYPTVSSPALSPRPP
jgi:hypothetical protein